MKKHLGALVAACTIATLAATPAFATNVGTKSGVGTKGCAVDWKAAAVLDPTLKNDDATYPNLMIDLDGKPAYGGGNAYTNGGYITDVRREYGGPGMLEVNHFYLDSSTGVFRIPTATDDAISHATVIVQLPTDVENVQFDAVSTNATIAKWGPAYSGYTWAPTTATATALGGNRYELSLGDLAAKQGTVYQFTFHVPAGTTQPRYVATAELTGTYAPGTQGCTAGKPVDGAVPTPTPSTTPTTPTTTPTTLAPTTTPSATPSETATPAPAASTPATVDVTVPATSVATPAPVATAPATSSAAAPGLAHTGGRA